MKEHHLKTLPEHFDAVSRGVKCAELRVDDRGFEVGDALVLEEFGGPAPCMDEPCPEWDHTGREERRTIAHVLRGGPWLGEGYVMLSLAPVCPHGFVIGDEDCEKLHCSKPYFIGCTYNLRAGIR